MRAIVIDDEPAMVRGITRHVNWTNLGFEVPKGVTGSYEALECMNKEHFDVVITDIQMPQLGGLELIKKIRENTEEVNIIIISGYDKFRYAQEAIGLGVCAYLLKPLRIEELEKQLSDIYNKEIQKSVAAVISIADGIHAAPIKSIHPTIKKIIGYIDVNYKNDISVNGMASIFNINSNYLSALFKKETGVNLNTYINVTRMEKASEILKKTDKRISEIAYEVGFTNPSYFTEQFRNHFGYSPSELRRNQVNVTL